MDFRSPWKADLFCRWGALALIVFLSLISTGLVVPDGSKLLKAGPNGSSAPPLAAEIRPAANPPFSLKGKSPTSSIHSQIAQHLSAKRLPHYQTIGKLPLIFEPNAGQSDGTVKFMARGSGYGLFLTNNEALLVLRNSNRESKSRGQRSRVEKGSRQGSSWMVHSWPSTAPRPGLVTPAVLRMKLVGANPAPNAIALDELPGKSNYLIGNDPAKWRTHIPLYARVAFQKIYPGVDLVYYGNQGQLECDFVVAPGANPEVIRLGIHGASKLAIDTQGDLLMRVGAGDVRLHRPTVFQESQGIRRTISARYRFLKGRYEVGLQVGPFDNRKQLVIDPVLFYSSYLGGSLADRGTSIAADPRGAVYITGQTFSTAPSPFPTTPGTLQVTLSGPSDAFVSKFDTTQSGAASLVYSTYLGGSGDEAGNGIAVDSAGSAYVTGQTSSVDFPTTPGTAFQTALNGPTDAFLAKLDPMGATLAYSTYLGGSDMDSGNSIVVASGGVAYLTGLTTSVDFPLSSSPLQGTPGGGQDAFVAKIDTTLSAGASLVYSTYLGGSGDETGSGIAVDSAGSSYVTGQTSSVDFPTTPGTAFQTGLNGPTDAFLAKLDPTGTTLAYSTYLGGGGMDSGNGIAAASSGVAYLTGLTSSVDFPLSSSPLQGVPGGGQDAFVAKIDTAQSGGASLVYSTYLGGSGDDHGSGIAADSSGNIYVVGTTASMNFPVAAPLSGLSTYRGGATDAFVTKLNSAGTALILSTYLGGSGADAGSGIALDAMGAVSVVGSTDSSNFPTVNAFQVAAAGSTDAFVSKLANLVLPVASISPTSLDFGSQNVTTTSPPMTVTLTNNGDGPLTVTTITIVGTHNADFAKTENCVSSSPIPPGGNCTINVTFTPTATGARNANLAINDDAWNSPQTVNLTGTGTMSAVMLSTNALTFPNEVVGSTSPAQTVTLTNIGTGPLTVTAVTRTGDFAQTNDCVSGSPIPPGQTCAIHATFKPTLRGARSGTLTIMDDASDSPQTVRLTGTGIGPAVTLSTPPTGLTFPDQIVGIRSAAKTVILTNTGETRLTFRSPGIVITGADSGDFAQSNNCGTGREPQQSCTITVTFTPASSGTRNAQVTITDDATDSPQRVTLTGTGLNAPHAALSPASMTFASQVVGTSSAVKTVTLSNTGNRDLTISNLSVIGDNFYEFGETNNCGPRLTMDTSCTFQVTFAPLDSGARTAELSIADNASGSPHTVTLSGTGADFAISASPGSASVNAGGTASYDISLTSLGGFQQAVTLTCTGAPLAAICGVTPASVTLTPTGATARVVVLTLNRATVAPRSGPRGIYPPSGRWLQSPWWAWLLALLALMAMSRAAIRSAGKSAWLGLSAIMLLAMLWASCGGGGGGGPSGTVGTPAGNYTLTFTATSGGLVHKSVTTLTVQ